MLRANKQCDVVIWAPRPITRMRPPAQRIGSLLSSVRFAAPSTFHWTVPAGVTVVTCDVYGAAGGSTPGALGGWGGYTRAVLPATPGDVWQINVGGAGINSSTTTATQYTMAGFNGGGNGRSGYAPGSGAGGGGSSDILPWLSGCHCQRLAEADPPGDSVPERLFFRRWAAPRDRGPDRGCSSSAPRCAWELSPVPEGPRELGKATRRPRELGKATRRALRMPPPQWQGTVDRLPPCSPKTSISSAPGADVRRPPSREQSRSTHRIRRSSEGGGGGGGCGDESGLRHSVLISIHESQQLLPMLHSTVWRPPCSAGVLAQVRSCSSPTRAVDSHMHRTSRMLQPRVQGQQRY